MGRRRIFHVLFNVAVVGKGIDSALEIVGGALLRAFTPAQIHNVVRVLTQHELIRDPHDVVADYLLDTTARLSPGAQSFAAIYLILHGTIKLVLVAALLRKWRAAYPAAIVAFGLFLAYQLYRYAHTHAPELLALSVFDVLVIATTWIEYRRLRASDRADGPGA